MKNQYVGDINDYIKYTMLRKLVAHGADVAVAWMLTANDDRGDGQKVGYLRQPDKYRLLDPPLFDLLGRIVEDGERSIDAIESSGALGNTTFVSHELSDQSESREEYFASVWLTARNKRMVFFDPDNGFEVASIKKGRPASRKYLYWDEVRLAYSRGLSVVVYQHFPRRARDAFLQDVAARVQAETSADHVLALVTSHVAFVFVPQPSVAREFEAQIGELSASLKVLGLMNSSLWTMGSRTARG